MSSVPYYKHVTYDTSLWHTTETLIHVILTLQRSYYFTNCTFGFISIRLYNKRKYACIRKTSLWEQLHILLSDAEIH